MPATTPFGKPFDNDPLKSYGYQTRATYRAFDRTLQRHIGHALSNGFWYLLRVLWQRDGMSQRELADAANLTESSTMLMLESMRNAGLIRKRRDTSDRRRSNVFLTAKAKRLKPKLVQNAAAVNAIATRNIPQRDLETYLRVAIQMRVNLNASADEAR